MSSINSEITFTCYACQTENVANVYETKSRRWECPKCYRPLHCCKQCVYYDRSYAKDCKEPSAQGVIDKESANFCDFFISKTGSAEGIKLPPTKEELKQRAMDLFKKNP